jgi:predicted dehydrogenase
MTIRCAIIGCGPSTAGKGGEHSISYAHGEGIRRASGMELVAAASRTRKNIDDFCAEFDGCEGYQDYRLMLSEQTADLVAVCAYPPDREAMVRAAIDNGARAVVIEKPMAVSLDSARRMMAAAAKTGCRLFVHHQRRYGQPFEWWRDAVANGEIGELESIAIAQPDGPFMDFGPHLVDAALFALGVERQAVRVMGAVDTTVIGDYQGIPVESQLLGSVHFNDGVRLSVEAGQCTCAQLPILRANGTRGFAELLLEPKEGEGCVFRKVCAGGNVASPATNEHFHHSEDGALYVQRAYEDFQRALNDGGATRLDAAEALRGLEIIMGIYESARLGRMLELA